MRAEAPISAPVLALDVGGTKLAAGVVEPGGRVLSFAVTPAAREQGPDEMIRRMIDIGRSMLAESGVERSVAVVGVGCGGPLDPERGIIHAPPNLPGWDDIPLGDLVTAAFGRPACIENDATAAAMAEWRWGAGRGADVLVYLTLSTGIGGGAIVHGRPLRGRSGNAAELGHVSVRFDGWACVCGRRGCPEAFASGTNVARRAREAIQSAGSQSSLAGIPGSPAAITARHVAEAAEAGDDVARQVWDDTTTVIGELVASALNAFDPDIVVLGGGLTNAGRLLLEPVVARAHAVAMPPMRSTPIVISPLGDRIGVLGAAAVALDRASTPALVPA